MTCIVSSGALNSTHSLTVSEAGGGASIRF